MYARQGKVGVPRVMCGVFSFLIVFLEYSGTLLL